MQSFQLHERASTVPTNSYTRQDWQRGYESVKEESDYWIDDVEGQIPPELQGTLFRNGPGLLVNGQRIHHGGMARSTWIALHNACSIFRRTKVGKILYRGVFGTQKPGGWL